MIESPHLIKRDVKKKKHVHHHQTPQSIKLPCVLSVLILTTTISTHIQPGGKSKADSKQDPAPVAEKKDVCLLHTMTLIWMDGL